MPSGSITPTGSCTRFSGPDPKGSFQFREISWEEAHDRVAERFRQQTDQLGAETVWPYYYAGTMGLVQRDGINRLRHAMGLLGSEDHHLHGPG